MSILHTGVLKWYGHPVGDESWLSMSFLWTTILIFVCSCCGQWLDMSILYMSIGMSVTRAMILYFVCLSSVRWYLTGVSSQMVFQSWFGMTTLWLRILDFVWLSCRTRRWIVTRYVHPVGVESWPGMSSLYTKSPGLVRLLCRPRFFNWYVHPVGDDSCFVSLLW